MSSSRSNYLMPLNIAANLFPMFGVLFYDWDIFSVVYIYWVELIIISTFQLFRILLSSGTPVVPLYERFAMGLRFFAFRTGIFFFYLIFIIAFLGIIISSKGDIGNMQMWRVLTLRSDFFLTAMLSFTVYNLVEFIADFVSTEYFNTTQPKDYYSIFDVRIIVVHIVVVVGANLYTFVLEKSIANHKVAMAIIVALFIAVKLLVDAVKQWVSNSIATPNQKR